MILHGYWRSGASYRVRIALNLKGLAYDNAAHDLRKGEQKAPDYLKLSPNGKIPTIVDRAEGRAIFESGAILWHLAQK